MIATKETSRAGQRRHRVAEEKLPCGGNSIPRNMADLARDAVRLAELQVKLARREASAGLRGLVVPVGLVIATIAMALGSVPIVLLAVVSGIHDYAGWRLTESLAVVACVSLLLAFGTGVAGWYWTKQRLNIFERTSQEMQQNVEWFKHVIGSDD